jgi:hypothetical protein
MASEFKQWLVEFSLIALAAIALIAGRGQSTNHAAREPAAAAEASPVSVMNTLP